MYVNIGKTDMSNTEQVIKVLGHENMHATGERSEVVAERAEDQATNAWERENAYNGNTTGGGYENGTDFYVSQADTSTVRMGSEQAAGVDDVAARMTVQAHEVEVGPMKTGKFHASIKFKPENQELYEGDDDFMVDSSDGKLYTTLGAGPGVWNRLTGKLRRDTDMENSTKVLESLPIVPVEQEDQVFQQLIELNKNYNQQRLEYDAIPDPNKVKTPRKVTVEIGGTEPDDVFPPTTITYMGESHNQFGDSYNSNSYVSGILGAADIAVPPLDKGLDLPGYNKPVPEKYFNDVSTKRGSLPRGN